MNILVTIPKGIIFDSFIPEFVQNKLESIAEVEYNQTNGNFTPSELREKLADKDAVITGWSTAKLTHNVLEGNNRLKIIAHTGGTVSSIVDDSAYDMNIKVLSGNEIYAESVGEAVIAYALAALRRIPDFCTVTKNDGWYDGSLWEGLLDQTIGIVGYGMIAKHLVRFLTPFHTKIKVYSSHISDQELNEYNMEKASLKEIFSTCKIFSLHSAMNEKTFHMIDKPLLEKIQPGALLINTARGAIINEPALIEELKSKRFRAILDVFEQEPLPAGHPLRKMDNVYVIPHMGGPTYDRRKFVTLALAEDIQNYFMEKPLRLEISRQYAGMMTK
jgi:phosphoglycerate dehydrogenase-like enzyme